MNLIGVILSRLVPLLHFDNDWPGEEPLTLAARAVCGRLLGPAAQLHSPQQAGEGGAEAALSRILAALSQRLYTADNKHLTVRLFQICSHLGS